MFRVLSALLLICSLSPPACTARSRPPPLSFEEAGLVPAAPTPAAAPARRSRSPRLDAAIESLLSAIERELGERPVLEEEDDEAPPLPEDLRSVRRRSRGWTPERAALAAELQRALDTGEATLRSAQRARAALLWDLQLGARWTAVDRHLVEAALARVSAVLAPERPLLAEPAVSRLPFIWPVDPVRITSRFGVRIDPFGEGERRHSGVDLAAVIGQRVVAAAHGTVVFAGVRGRYGLHVELRHDGGVVTRYAHLSELEVRRGDPVRQGQLLGRAGRTGRTTGPHLHFELWRYGLPIDPVDTIDGGYVQLGWPGDGALSASR